LAFCDLRFVARNSERMMSDTALHGDDWVGYTPRLLRLAGAGRGIPAAFSVAAGDAVWAHRLMLLPGDAK
jgi:hypothetical protein